jgi:hypothetical protein
MTTNKRAFLKKLSYYLDQFLNIEKNDDELTSEVLSDFYKYVKEGKREYLKNIDET